MTGNTLTADADSFHRFHNEDLIERIEAGNGPLAWTDVEHLGSIGLRTPAGSYTYAPVDGTVAVTQGDDDADTVVELDFESWLGLISDLDTAPGLFYGGRVEVPRGKPLRFVRWEPGLRALFHGMPIFDPDTADLRDRQGEPLDVAHMFTIAELEADISDARHFLMTAGYLAVSDVFASHEVAQFLDDAAVLEREAVPGDDASWWGRNSDGDEILTRVLRAVTRPSLKALHDDPRLALVASVPGQNLESRRKDANDSVTVLWKRPDMTEGLGDLPWHRDCGMGGHAMNCPMAVMTICLTTGAPEAGELRFLPGSHAGSYPFVDGTDTHAPRGVSIPVTAGDVTLHYSDIMHASMPPTSSEGPHRISVLKGFISPSAGHHRGGRHYNDVLLGNDGGQVEHLGQALDADAPS
jgi:ectoine hydroxylase-related dioxygenase (phytanoyl-CoA dioxygenase family)